MQSTQNMSHNSLQHLIAKGTHCQPTCYCSIDYLPCLHQIHFLCFVSCRCWTCSVSPTPTKIGWRKVYYVFDAYVSHQIRSRSETAWKGTYLPWHHLQVVLPPNWRPYSWISNLVAVGRVLWALHHPKLVGGMFTVYLASVHRIRAVAGAK